MEWLAGCLSLKADRQVFTPVLEAAPAHINHNQQFFSNGDAVGTSPVVTPGSRCSG